ncbi:MAG TPA: hypothetical protein VIJ93_14115 [bacterium]
MRAKKENPNESELPSKKPNKDEEVAYNRWLKSGAELGDGLNNSLEAEQDAMKKTFE